MDVERIIKHSNYNRRNLDNDIALLELSGRLEFSDSVQPIVLPDANERILDGSMCLVSGWGETERLIIFRRSQLRAAEVPIVNQEKCNNVYKMVGSITKRMLCAGFDNGGRDACQGKCHYQGRNCFKIFPL